MRCMACSKRKYDENTSLSKTRSYVVWCGMKSRVEDPAHKTYPRYGGRGITICERWQNFANFFTDMGERPEKKTLGRIDNDGPYSPDNCRWETLLEQSRNKSTNRFASFTCPCGCGHTTTMTISEWERALSVGRQMHPARYDNGKRDGK